MSTPREGLILGRRLQWGWGGLLLGALRVGFGDGKPVKMLLGVLRAVWNGAPRWRFQTWLWMPVGEEGV